MSAIGIQIPQENLWENIVRVYRRHSDLVSQITLFTLNTAIAAAKVFEQIPKIIPRSSLTMLNFTGLIWINMQISSLIKSGKDLILCAKAADFEGFVFTAVKVAVKALNLLLTGSMLAASLVALAGSPQITLSMYAAMQPVAMISFMLGIGTDVYDYEKNGALAQQLEKMTLNQEKVTTLAGDLLKLLEGKASKNTLARHLICQLDHHSLEALKETHHKMTSLEMVQKIKEALALKRSYTQAHLGLIVVGYAGMGICRLWPDTLVQSAVTWSISLFYTAKLIWQKTTQPLQ